MSLTQVAGDDGEVAVHNVGLMFKQARQVVATSDLAFLTLGRGRGNDLEIEDAKHIGLEVSKTHAAFTCDVSDNVSIMDVCSANGTFVNDTRLRPYMPRLLRDGDIIRLGNQTIQADGFHVNNPLVFLWSATDPPPTRARARRREAPLSREDALMHLSCSICMEPIVSARVTTCGHTACHACLVSWFLSKRTCPTCRTEQPPGVRPAPCHAIDALVAAYMSTGGGVAERALFDRRVAHAKIADAVRARCDAIGHAKD
jgi:hypothetical protein